MLKNMRPKVIRYETDLVLVASCPIQWQAPRLESFVQGLRERVCDVPLFWIFPNLEGQRNPKWPAKLKHPNDSYLTASVKTVRVVGEKCGNWFKCSVRPRIQY